MGIENIVQKHYEKKSPQTVLALIVEQLKQKYTLKEGKEQVLSWSSIPEIPISEIGWSNMTTRGGKEVPSEERAQLLNFLENIPGDDFKSKINGINKFYKFDAVKLQEEGFFGDTQASMISQIMAYLVFYKTLTTIITHFNAASAGFSFESFLGVLLGGIQIKTGSKTIADFTMADGTPVSLKLYAEKSLKVGGSYNDLINDLVKDGKMQYIAVTKDLNEVKPGKELQQDGTLAFYQFNFNVENIVNILAQSAGSQSPKNIILPFAYEEELKNNPAFRIEDVLAQAGRMPSAQELENLFVDELRKEVDASAEAFANLKTKDGSDFKFEDFTEMIDWAKDDAIFTKNKQRGTAKTRIDTITPLFNKFGNHYLLAKKKKNKDEYRVLSLENVKFLLNAVRAANDRVNARFAADVQTKQRTGQIKDAYFGKEAMAAGTDLEERSRELYNELASEEHKRGALLNSYGYVRRPKHNFELNQNMIMKIDQLAGDHPGELFPEGQDGVGVGTIEIGAAQINKMLKSVSQILNNAIFDIFNNVKILTTNIQGYFAGGLKEDAKANTAKTAANDIEKKTEKVQKGDVGGDWGKVGQTPAPRQADVMTLDESKHNAVSPLLEMIKAMVKNTP